MRTCDECSKPSEALDKCGCPNCDGSERAPLICSACATKPFCPGPSRPDILCSSCGDPLVPVAVAGSLIQRFYCQPCNRILP